MSEYIYATNEPLMNEDGNIFLAREEIIRCSDCVECEHWEATKHKPERYICLALYCIEVNPDDFCSMGERRDDA